MNPQLIQQPIRPFWMGQFPNTYWEVVQGDCMAYYIEMFCDCPTVVDITGYQFQFEVKESMDPQADELLEVLWTSLRGECGITALIVIPKLTAALPDGRYAMELRARSPSGLVTTLERGDFGVLPAVNLELSAGLEVPPVSKSITQYITGYSYTQGF
jgi:hypothetical protein